MTCQGTVKSFNALKGWGFLAFDGKDVFLHVKDCKDGTPASGDLLTFDVEEDPISGGRMKASNVTGCTGVAEAKGKGKGKVAGTGSSFGLVKSFNTQKGWGFITLDGVDIFVHAKDCHGGAVPQVGDTVQFDVEDDQVRGNGNKKASNVTGGTGWDSYNGGGDGGGGGGGGSWKGGDGGFGKGKGKGGYGPMWDGGYGKGCWGKDSWGASPYGKGCWGKDSWGGGGCWGKGYGKCMGGW